MTRAPLREVTALETGSAGDTIARSGYSVDGTAFDLKLNLGCGHVQPPGWVNVDNSNRAWVATHLSWLDRLFVALRILPPTEFNPTTTFWFNLKRRFNWPTDSVDAIYAGELLEHYTRHDGEKLLRECLRVLKPGGVIRIRVPDNARFWMNYVQEFDAMKARPRAEWQLDHTRWIEMFFRDICVKQRMVRSMGHFHKWMYDEISLIKTLERLGFENVDRMDYRRSRLADVASVEVRDDLIVEATKPV